MSNIYNLLGLCMKAGKLSSGEDSVMTALKKNKDLYLGIIAEDISEASKKKYELMFKLKKIDYIFFGKKEELGRAIGKSERTLMIIHEKNLAKKIMDSMEN